MALSFMKVKFRGVLCLNCKMPIHDHVRGTCLFQPTQERRPSDALLRKLIEGAAGKRDLQNQHPGKMIRMLRVKFEYEPRNDNDNVKIKVEYSVEGRNTDYMNWYIQDADYFE